MTLVSDKQTYVRALNVLLFKYSFHTCGYIYICFQNLFSYLLR